jgi:hypothetical protein
MKFRPPPNLPDFDESDEQSTIVSFGNVFDRSEMILNPCFCWKLITDFTTQCEQFGKVIFVKPIVFRDDGIVLVRFERRDGVDAAIEHLHVFEYCGRMVVCERWENMSDRCNSIV